MSIEFDTMAPNFYKMVERWPDAPTLGEHYLAVVESFEGNQHGLVDSVKSFVECVCLTILGEYGKSMPSTYPPMMDLFIEAMRLLGLQNSRGASKLDKVLSAHNRLADALNDMRNENGHIAHGKDGFLDSLTKNHMRTYLLTADTLLALILAAFEGTEPDLQFTREPYERYNHLHDRIDMSVTVESSIEYEDDLPMVLIAVNSDGLTDGVKLRIEPSRLLYAIDRTAYIEILAASTTKVTAKLREEGPKAEGMPMLVPKRATEEMPSFKIISTYTGYLSPLVDELCRYLATLNLSQLTKDPSGANMISSLLGTAEVNMGTDWREREALQTRMNVAFRRTMNHFGISDKVAKDGAEHLVVWFKNHTAQLNSEKGAAL